VIRSKVPLDTLQVISETVLQAITCLVRTTKINSKIYQINTEKNKCNNILPTNMHTNVILTNKRCTHTHNLAITIQN